MLNTGSQAPEFTLENERGEATTLADLLADGPLILYFYPADFTPGCTKEACDIRDIHGSQHLAYSPKGTYLIDQDRRIADAVQADIRIGKHRSFIDKAIALRNTD